MKKEIIYYKKCLCCGKLGGYIMRSDNTNTSIKDKDVYLLIADAIKHGFGSEWCGYCNMMTKQEEVAWDYIDGKKANIPEENIYYDDD